MAFDASQGLVEPSAPGARQLYDDVADILTRTLPILGLLDEGRDGDRPSRDDIHAVRAAGWPWNVIADIAEVFLALERGGAEALARRLIKPGGLPEAVFQLSVLGTILNACEALGGAVTSLRPIGYMTDGPVYRISFADERPWELWCEAARSWEHYGVPDGYRMMASSLQQHDGGAFLTRNIRPDVLLARMGDGCCVFECKYPGDTLDPGYVAHGLYQSNYYAQQLSPAFESVRGLVVGPDELVQSYSSGVVGGQSLGILGPRHIADVIANIVGKDIVKLAARVL